MTRSNLAEKLPESETMSTEESQAALDPLNKVLHQKTVRQHVKEFAALFAAIFLGIAAYLCYHHHSFADVLALVLVAGIMVLLGYRFPWTLRKVWEAWMYLGKILEMVFSPVILGLMWWLILVPISLLLRVLGMKVMNTKFRESDVASYWEQKDKKYTDFKLLERQF